MRSLAGAAIDFVLDPFLSLAASSRSQLSSSGKKTLLARLSAVLCCAVICQLCLSGCGGSSRPKSIEFSSGSGQLSLAQGATLQLEVNAVYANGRTIAVTGLATYQTSNADAATVTTAGKITAVAAGTATMTATYDGLTVAATVTVTRIAPTLTSIAVTPATFPLAPAATQQLKVVATFSDSTTQDVTSSSTYASSASSFATVSATGLVTGVAAGSATITASYQGQNATAAATVAAAVPTLTGIAATPAMFSLAPDTTQQLRVIATFSDSTTRDVTSSSTYTTSASSFATVSPAGLVTGVAQGSATITASYQGQVATAIAMVAPVMLVPTSISVTSTATSVVQGASQQLLVTAIFGDGATQNVTSAAIYISSAPAVATVSTTGVVTGVSVGTAIITATYQGVSGTDTITVTAPTATSVALTASSTSLPAGSTAQLQATATYNNGMTGDVTTTATYTSSNSAVATVNSAGLITAVGIGTALITASYEGQSGTVTITVTAATATSVALTASSTSLPAGTTAQLQATATYTNATTVDVTSSATYTTSNAAAATVSASGQVTAVAVGTAVITATYQGKSGTVTITVTAPAIVGITINPGLVQLANGTTVQLQALASFTDGTLSDVTGTATWSVSPSVATISVSGLLTAVGTGTAPLTATVSGISGSADITVSAATLQSILLLPQNPTLSAGGTLQLTGQGVFTDGSTQEVTSQLTFTTSDPSVATVSNSGLISGVAPGSVTITATASAALGSQTTSLTLVVTSATLESIAVTPTGISLAAGLTQQMTASGTFSDGSIQNLTQSAAWASSSTNVAIVDAHGNVTALNVGTATITATIAGVPVASATVTVTNATIVGLTITPGSISLAIGQNLALAVTATLTDGTTRDVTAQASLSISGGLGSIVIEPATNIEVVLALSVGSGTVTATLDGQTAQATLTIGASQITGITLPPTLSLAAGTMAGLQIEAQYTDGSSHLLLTNLSFTSSTPSVATVGAIGTITGLTAGNANITATYSNPSGPNYNATTAVTVTAATLQSITLSASASLQVVGIPIQLTVIGNYSDGSQADLTAQVYFTCSNPLIATVSSLGIVLPLGIGAVQINVSLGGVTGNISLNIGSAVLQSVAVTAPATLSVGGTSHLTAIGTFSDSSQQDVSSQVAWSSNNPSVGVVSAAGNATAVSVGTFAAIATLNGISGSASIQVTSAAPPTLVSITVTPTNINLIGGIVSLLGANTQFTATGNYSDGSTLDLTSTVQWSTSNGATASINSQGQLQLTLGGLLGLLGLGQNTITVIATQGSISGSTQMFLTVL